ncbi:autotransporter-associated beta strand repeat-containing protein [Maribellus sediminis]|uniref:rhamnogalacturonan lyase family protein n=1 Tax=Maribellus sediminis TaxID=2696285 RepID=UPI0014318149|nr:autotransporter-associated beta strand repeat-containing protein [Maribellus sediminis]
MKQNSVKFLKIFIPVFLIIFSSNVMAQRYMEQLNHGLVAVKKTGGVFVSWRVLGSEWDDVAYNLYRDGSMINSEPITGASNFWDTHGTTSATYTIKTVIKGVEQEGEESASVWDKNYIDIPVREINGGSSSYILNDASVGDLDGDGEYEIVVKRLATGGAESSDYHYLEAYKLDGTFLWAVNMGPNIYNDVEFNFLVWDLDCDGKAEVTLRTSDGFIDGEGNNIGDADNDGVIDYRYSISGVGYRMEGPDYLSVLDGQTGKELDRASYIPRGNITDWGRDDGGHRSTKCMFTIAYQDGKTPSVVISRGIYERIVMESWKFKNGSLSKNWNFDSNNHPDYAQQGYHNLTQGDVDFDGRDEVNYGSMVMDDNGQGLYSTKLGHGDAQHLTDINPDRDGLEFFGCLENSAGGNYRDARTGEILHYTNIGRDMGRAGCADITPDYPGMEMWGPSGFPFLSSTGDAITNLTPPASMNFFIWWDGDLSREMLDHAWYSNYGVGTITKYNNGANTQLLYATGTLSDNWTKGNPAVSADILGDWREEVIWRTSDNKALRLYTTTDITSQKIYTLMHDPQYRAAIGWQPNSYNQPPHPGFFIGTDMDSVPPAPILFPGQKVWTSGKWDIGTTSAWISNSNSANFEEGDKVLFDISGDNNSAITLEGSLKPEDIRVISPIDYVFAGSGSIDGTTDLTKSGSGNLILNNSNGYTGITRVWDGQLTNNGTLENSKVLVKRFATLAGNGTFNKGIVLEKHANLIVSKATVETDTTRVNGVLETRESSTIYMDLTDDVTASSKTNDMIMVDGALVITGMTTISINRVDGKLSAGEYVLMTVSDTLTGNLEDIAIEGIEGTPYTLEFEDHKLKLVVADTRMPGTIIWSGAVDNKWDLFNRLNWSNKGTADYFLGEDSVIFDDSGLQTNVEILDDYAISNFLFDAEKNYTIKGSGSFSGPADLIKKGSGRLTILTQNSYTGATIIEEGTLRVQELVNAGYASAIGAASAEAANIIIDGGELEVTNNTGMSTDKNITLGINDGAITIANTYGNLLLAGTLHGNGRLIKNGSGTLSLKNGNSHKGTIINEGTLQLADDPANIWGLGDTVTLNGGTLAMNDNSYSYTDGCRWHIVVPEGKTGTLKLDSRSSLTGKLFGSGKLILYSPWIRNDLNGDWSNFTGTIQVTADGDGGDWRINNRYGYENASVILSSKVYAYNLINVETKLGSLSGSSSSTLAPGTWSVGFNNQDATYSGLITGVANINKYGTGNWTLTHANDYSGSTNVYEGTLTVDNISGSATGSGGVFVREGAMLEGNGSIDGTVGIYSDATCNMGASSNLNGMVNIQGSLVGKGNINDRLTILSGGIRKGENIINAPVIVRRNGILSGEGSIRGNLTLYEGAIVAPGTDGLGILTFDKDVVLVNDAILEIEINNATKENDVLKTSGMLTLDGTLKVAEVGGVAFEAGNSFELFEADSVGGEFDVIEPATPGEGLEWDLSNISAGILGVTSVTSVNTFEKADIVVYPNPGTGTFYLKRNTVNSIKSISVANMDGRIIYSDVPVSSERIELDLQDQPAGIYFLRVTFTDKEIIEKLVKK